MRYSDPLQPAGGWAAPETLRLPPPPVAERGLLFRALSLASRWPGTGTPGWTSMIAC